MNIFQAGGVNLATRVVFGSSSNSEIQSNNTYSKRREGEKKEKKEKKKSYDMQIMLILTFICPPQPNPTLVPWSIDHST